MLEDSLSPTLAPTVYIVFRPIVIQTLCRHPVSIRIQRSKSEEVDTKRKISNRASAREEDTRRGLPRR